MLQDYPIVVLYHRHPFAGYYPTADSLQFRSQASPVFCSSDSVHKRHSKNGKGLVSFITWMTSGGRKVDARLKGKGTNHKNNALDYPFKCSTAVLDLRRWCGQNYSLLEFIHYRFEYWPLPYILPRSTRVINETRPSPFFAVFCFVNTNRRTKNGGGLGTGLRWMPMNWCILTSRLGDCKQFVLAVFTCFSGHGQRFV